MRFYLRQTLFRGSWPCRLLGWHLKIWTIPDTPNVWTCAFCDANSGGFLHQKSGIWILDPYLSSCGRFKVDPIEEYGQDYLDWLAAEDGDVHPS